MKTDRGQKGQPADTHQQNELSKRHSPTPLKRGASQTEGYG
jgi:hypothetical protein